MEGEKGGGAAARTGPKTRAQKQNAPPQRGSFVPDACGLELFGRRLCFEVVAKIAAKGFKLVYHALVVGVDRKGSESR